MLFDNPTVDVTISLRIHDVRAFVKAARKQAIAEGIDPEEARTTYKATDLGACAVMLLDPGTSPSGSEILESSSETY